MGDFDAPRNSAALCAGGAPDEVRDARCRQETARLLEADAVSWKPTPTMARRRMVSAHGVAALAAACAGAAVCAAAAAALRAPASTLSAPAPGGLSGLADAWEATAFDATNIISADTRFSARVSSMIGGHGRHFVNYGAGMRWTDFRTKIAGWLVGATERAAENADAVVIIADTDIIDGGCSDAEILDRYRRIVRASGGARIVVGVDPVQFPKLAGAVERFMAADLQARRAAILAEFGMHEEVFNQWYDLGTSYSFVNSGFIMGPAALVVRTLECIQVFGRLGRGFDDQAGLTRCAAMHPDIITLDYTGGLVLDVHGFKVGILKASPAGIVNGIFGGTQCFVHMNGHKLPEMRPWMRWYSTLGYTDFNQQTPVQAVA